MNPPSSTRVAAVIGAAGGTLTSLDGKAVLVVPPNALEADAELSVEPMAISDGLGLPSSGYEFAPDGLHFLLAAELSIQNQGIDDPALQIVKIFADETRRAHDTTVDLAQHRATAEIPGFSNYAVAFLPIRAPMMTATQQGDRSILLSFGSIGGGPPPQIKVERAVNHNLRAEETEFQEYVTLPPGQDYSDHPTGPAAVYHYRARSYTNTDLSSPSQTISIADFGDAIPVDVPHDFRATALSSTSVRLTWTPVANSLGYLIENKLGSGPYRTVARLDGTDQSYEDTGLTPESDYTYRINSSAVTGDSDWSYAAVRTHLGWVQLGTAMNRDPTRSATPPSVTVAPNGQIYGAWSEGAETTGGVFVGRWDGSAWIQVGGGLEVRPNSVSDEAVAIQIDAQSRPLVSFLEGGSLYVRRWNGANWDLLGGDLLVGAPGDNFVLSQSLALGSDGNPAVAFSQGQSGNSMQKVYVRRYDGNAWLAVGAALDSADNRGVSAPSLRLDANDRPVLGFNEKRNNRDTVVVTAYSGTAWSELGAAPPSADFPGPAVRASLAQDAAGAWVVAYSQADVSTGAQTAEVRRFDGTDWQALPDPQADARNAYEPKITLGGDGRLYVAYSQDGFPLPNSSVVVRAFDGALWSTVGDAEAAQEAAFLRVSSVAAGRSGVVVAWGRNAGDGSPNTAQAAAFGL